MSKNKLFIKTMGCQMNEYDSEKMADVLRESQGFTLTTSPEEADLLLVNTCSIREKAQEKVFSELGPWPLAGVEGTTAGHHDRCRRLRRQPGRRGYPEARTIC
jgi:tRNA A37 methylthiotransferase MiaB